MRSMGLEFVNYHFIINIFQGGFCEETCDWSSNDSLYGGMFCKRRGFRFRKAAGSYGNHKRADHY